MKKKILSLMLIVLLIASVFTGCSCEHEYTTSTTKEATCAAEGEITKTCSKCGDEVIEAIPKSKHHYDVGHVIKKATCSEEGKKECTCIYCGATKIETIQGGTHKYIEKITQQATCTEDGKRILTCSLCGYSTTGAIISEGHKWEEASCTKPKTCSTCKITTGSALGHTCTVGECSRCKQTFEPKITLLTKLPATFTFGEATKIKISEVSLYFENGSMKMSFVAEKVYDSKGASGTNRVGFNCIVKDADGFVVEKSSWPIDDLKVGDKIKREYTIVYGSQFTEISESYTVELLSYN